MNYNNTYIGIPLILRRQRSFLLRKFPELIKYRRKYDPIHILEAISIYCEVDANGDYCRQIIHIGSLSITSGDIGMQSVFSSEFIPLVQQQLQDFQLHIQLLRL